MPQANRPMSTYAKGERLPQAKLNPEKVREIRQSTDKNASLAAFYGVHESAIEHVRHFRTWRGVE